MTSIFAANGPRRRPRNHRASGGTVLSRPESNAIYSYGRRADRLISTISGSYIKSKGSAISLHVRRSSAIMGSSNCNIYISGSAPRTSVISCAASKSAAPSSTAWNSSGNLPKVRTRSIFYTNTTTTIRPSGITATR